MKESSAFTRPVYLAAPVRTPIGKFGGSLKSWVAADLATHALEACARQSDAPAQWVLLGHARGAGAGPNPARQAAVRAGLGESVPAITLNQACASGMAAIFSAVEKIALGRAESVFAGGVESMSNTPYFLKEARWGQRLGHGAVVDGMADDGFHCRLADMPMGETVERFIAAERGISRQDQDAFALLSQQRACQAWARGDFAAEVVPVPAKGKAPELTRDEHPRESTTAESLARLPPVFDPKGGTLTAGNSSGITDAAAFLRVTAERQGAFAQVVDMETVALDPKRMGMGPVPAIRALLHKHHLHVGAIEAFEINEAFAAQTLACQRELGIEVERLNAWGGAIALGHPIGASGARIVVTLLHRLRGKAGALGVASLCVSGGQGTALLVRSL